MLESLPPDAFPEGAGLHSQGKQQLVCILDFWLPHSAL